MSLKTIILVGILAAGLIVPSSAYSYSSSCIMKDGKMDCTQQTDPTGNMAAAGAAINGNQGQIAAGAGTPDNFNTDRQQINYGAGESANGFDEAGYGGIPTNLGGGIQPNFGGGMQPNYGGMQPNFGGGMQPNFGGGMQPNFAGGMQPNFGGGMQPNYWGGMQPNYWGGMQPNYGGGMTPNSGGGMPSSLGYGPNGVAVSSSSGFPPNSVPQWNGNPFEFVQGFMRNRGRR